MIIDLAGQNQSDRLAGAKPWLSLAAARARAIEAVEAIRPSGDLLNSRSVTHCSRFGPKRSSLPAAFVSKRLRGDMCRAT